MVVNNRIYRRTPAGDRALESKRSVPDWFRADLVTSSAICSGMRGHSQEQVLDWVDQLETLGFVERECIPPSSTPDAIATQLGAMLDGRTWGEIEAMSVEVR